VAGLLGLDAYLCAYHWADMVGNIEAQFVIVTPAFMGQHVALRRHADRQHAEQVGRQEAHAVELAAHREEMKAVAEKVGELHDLSIEGRLPARILKP
jgi:hypothetical protein